MIYLLHPVTTQITVDEHEINGLVLIFTRLEENSRFCLYTSWLYVLDVLDKEIEKKK